MTSQIEEKIHKPTREGGDRHRLQLDFSPQAYERLLKIRDRSGARTNAEVIRNALRFYDWFLEHKEEGAQLQIVKEGVTKEVELLFT